MKKVEWRKLVVELDLERPDPELATMLEPVIDVMIKQMEEEVERELKRLETLARLKAVLRLAGAL